MVLNKQMVLLCKFERNVSPSSLYDINSIGERGLEKIKNCSRQRIRGTKSCIDGTYYWFSSCVQSGKLNDDTLGP